MHVALILINSNHDSLMSNRNEVACGKKQDIWNQLHLGHENQTSQDDTPDYHNAMVRDIDLFTSSPCLFTSCTCNCENPFITHKNNKLDLFY